MYKLIVLAIASLAVAAPVAQDMSTMPMEHNMNGMQQGQAHAGMDAPMPGMEHTDMAEHGMAKRHGPDDDETMDSPIPLPAPIANPPAASMGAMSILSSMSVAKRHGPDDDDDMPALAPIVISSASPGAATMTITPAAQSMAAQVGIPAAQSVIAKAGTQPVKRHGPDGDEEEMAPAPAVSKAAPTPIIATSATPAATPMAGMAGMAGMHM